MSQASTTDSPERAVGQRISIFAYSRDEQILEADGTVNQLLTGPGRRTHLIVRIQKPRLGKFKEGAILALTGDGPWVDRVFHWDRSGPPWYMAEVKMFMPRRPDATKQGAVRLDEMIPVKDAHVVQAYGLDEQAPKKRDAKSLARYNMARRLAAWMKAKFGARLEFNESGILALDDAIDLVQPNPVPEGQLGGVVSGWSDFLLEAVARTLKGDIIEIPWNGQGVLVRAPSGWMRLVETGPRMSNRLHFGRSHSISAWWSRLKDDLTKS